MGTILRAACAASFILALAACSGGTLFSAPETPAQRVFATQALYNATLAAAVTYESLPRCAPEPTGNPCSDPDIVGKIRTSDAKAKIILDKAQELVRNGLEGDEVSQAIAAAQAAVAAFNDLLKEEKVL